MGTHPIFESDFDCLTDAMTNEESIFDLYWRHFDMTRDEYIGWCLLSFHLTHFVLLWLTWRRENMQIILFTSLGAMMLCAERINEYLAQQQWLARQNYFDSSGFFFTCVIGGPVVLNLLMLLFKWMKSSFDTMVTVKRHQLLEQQKQSNTIESKKID